MAFYEEQDHYYKTALSDLHGAWENLRDAVVEAHPFPESERLLLHINEGMSWESTRDLNNMRKVLLVIQNISNQVGTPGEVSEWVELVAHNLEEVFVAISKGEAQ